MHFNPNFANTFQQQQNQNAPVPPHFNNKNVSKISKSNSRRKNCYTLLTSPSSGTGSSNMYAIFAHSWLFSAIIMNINDKLANDIGSKSSNSTITFNANENLSMEQEIIPSHMQIMTHYSESTNPLHICRTKISAFSNKNRAKKSLITSMLLTPKSLIQICMSFQQKKSLRNSVFPRFITNMFAGNLFLCGKHQTFYKFLNALSTRKLQCNLSMPTPVN